MGRIVVFTFVIGEPLHWGNRCHVHRAANRGAAFVRVLDRNAIDVDCYVDRLKSFAFLRHFFPHRIAAALKA